MTIPDIERIENTTLQILLAFTGTRYVPRVMCANGVYSVTRRGSLTATITPQEIAGIGIYQRVAEICAIWDE